MFQLTVFSDYASPAKKTQTKPSAPPTAKDIAVSWKGGMDIALTVRTANSAHINTAPKPSAVACVFVMGCLINAVCCMIGRTEQAVSPVGMHPRNSVGANYRLLS